MHNYRSEYTRFSRVPYAFLTPHVFQMATQSREDSVYLAKLAEQAERYEGAFKLYLSHTSITAHTWQ